MEIENQDFDSENSESLLSKKEENKNLLKCSGKLIILIILGNIILIAICVVIIHFVAKGKVNKISGFFNNYLKDLLKVAITPNRIKHLIKKQSDDKYQTIVDIEKKIFNLTWEKMRERNQSAVGTLDQLITNSLFPGQKTISGISEDLIKIMTQKEDYKIYQLLDKDHLKELNEQLNDDGQRENLENKLKEVALYGLINFPLQISYFSYNDTIKNEYKDYIKEKLDYNIHGIINQEMEKYDSISDKAIYMVLGSAQDNERRRMEAIKPFINITNTGLRVQPTNSEFKSLHDNLDNYMNEDYKNLIIDCFADDGISNETYTNFINKCGELKNLGENNDYTDEQKEIFINYFNETGFSVETANTFIEYINLGVDPSNIHIIRLGEDKRRLNEFLEYNKNEVYILYNVYDIASTNYNLGDKIIRIKRATTESNVKTLIYLKREEEIFSLSDEDYNNLILVSSKGEAERQLEAFNIVFSIRNEAHRFNSVIWNKNYNPEINEEEMINKFLDIVVKSHNLFALSLYQFNDEKNRPISDFVKKAIKLVDDYNK